jgi:hypothetical protein
MGKHRMTDDLRACVPDCPGCITDKDYDAALAEMRAALRSLSPAGDTNTSKETTP